MAPRCVLHKPYPSVTCVLTPQGGAAGEEAARLQKAPSHLLGCSRSSAGLSEEQGPSQSPSLCPALRSVTGRQGLPGCQWLPQLGCGSAAPGEPGVLCPHQAGFSSALSAGRHRTAGVKPLSPAPCAAGMSLHSQRTPLRARSCQAGGGFDGKDTWPPGSWAGASSSFHTSSCRAMSAQPLTRARLEPATETLHSPSSHPSLLPVLLQKIPNHSHPQAGMCFVFKPQELLRQVAATLKPEHFNVLE